MLFKTRSSYQAVPPPRCAAWEGMTETVYVDCLRAVQNNEECQAMTAMQEPALQLVLPGTDPSYFMEL